MKHAITILKNARMENERLQTTDRKWLESTPSAKLRERLETNIEYRQSVIDDIDDVIETLEVRTEDDAA